MQAIHAGSRRTYGAPRMHAELADAGVAVSRTRLARVMRAAGVAGVSRRRAPRTTRRDSQAQPAPDRVERRFEADAHGGVCLVLAIAAQFDLAKEIDYVGIP